MPRARSYSRSPSRSRSRSRSPRRRTSRDSRSPSPRYRRSRYSRSRSRSRTPPRHHRHHRRDDYGGYGCGGGYGGGGYGGGYGFPGGVCGITVPTAAGYGPPGGGYGYGPPPPPPFGGFGRGGGAPLCRDYLNGACSRTRCRYLHDNGEGPPFGGPGGPRGEPRGPVRASSEELRTTTSLFVGNLSYQADELYLKELFGKHGSCSVNIGLDRMTGRSRGYAFVTFDERRDAEEAKEALTDYEVQGRRLRLDWDMGLGRKKQLGYISSGGDGGGGRSDGGGGRSPSPPRRSPTPP